MWQVTATDWDAGDNGRVRYSIPGSVSSIFHVDQRGVISAHETIDRERYDAFRLPVLAVDMASSSAPQTGSALVIITVEDVNDERPEFTQPTYLFTVDENQLPDTVVRTVQPLSNKYTSFIFYDNFGKCGPVFIRFSLLNSESGQLYSFTTQLI